MNRRILLWRAALGTAPTPAAVARWTGPLDYAHWSPSPHNVQPWRLRVQSATEAQFCYDPARLNYAATTPQLFASLRLRPRVGTRLVLDRELLSGAPPTTAAPWPPQCSSGWPNWPRPPAQPG